ncbi:MAG: hypothetical protein OEN50_10530, partial [Deltaproteobacteria bacterium]|nr:hypothetical protein [Deltaproteobacteria bacterium]
VNVKIKELERQLKESQILLEKRNAEIAELQTKNVETVKTTSTSKLQSAKGGQGVKPQTANNGGIEEDVRKKLHQFQYAVKYLEDQIKEKDQLLNLMAKKSAQPQAANAKNKADDELKAKIQQLEQELRNLGEQLQEKDGLLNLMAKRNRELVELKTKAEERLKNFEGRIDEAEAGNGSK